MERTWSKRKNLREWYRPGKSGVPRHASRKTQNSQSALSQGQSDVRPDLAGAQLSHAIASYLPAAAILEQLGGSTAGIGTARLSASIRGVGRADILRAVWAPDSAKDECGRF